ncbi:thermonuclease family protein [Celeribacter arenosi]|uniref:thermonuclease family protein n=1 Tax=Celeribacter arenosi TaxID=792649 RepID=UPI0031DF8A11
MIRLIIRAFFGGGQQSRKRTYPPPSRPSAPAQSFTSTPTYKPIYRTPAPKPSVQVEEPQPATITGKCYVVDGDTIRIGKVSLRLAGIDAPELEHPWGQKAKWELVKLCKGQTITAELEPSISYDRVVATCFLPDGRDLSAEMVKAGLALDWPKFSGGKYAKLEPEGVRKKHWKAAARQRGHMSVFHK